MALSGVVMVMVMVTGSYMSSIEQIKSEKMQSSVITKRSLDAPILLFARLIIERKQCR